MPAIASRGHSFSKHRLSGIASSPGEGAFIFLHRFSKSSLSSSAEASRSEITGVKRPCLFPRNEFTLSFEDLLSGLCKQWHGFSLQGFPPSSYACVLSLPMYMCDCIGGGVKFFVAERTIGSQGALASTDSRVDATPHPRIWNSSLTSGNTPGSNTLSHRRHFVRVRDRVLWIWNSTHDRRTSNRKPGLFSTLIGIPDTRMKVVATPIPEMSKRNIRETTLLFVK